MSGHDVVVVGSGPGGANAAATLVEAGLRVLMLDVGTRHAPEPALPERPFAEIRRHDAQQHRWFLGERFEGIPATGIGTGAQLTPPRQHVLARAPELVPTEAAGFTAAEGLALGGLGAAWGAGAFTFDDVDMAGWPIRRADLDPHYRRVAERVGVAADVGDLREVTGDPHAVMPALELDEAAGSVLARYERGRDALRRRGFLLGRTPLAACSRPFRGRDAHAGHDTDFWADPGRSVYRPKWTIDELRRSSAFTYLDDRLVLRFDETAAGVTLRAVRLGDRAPETHAARALVLAAGTFGTARIVLRSLDRHDTPRPFTCNPYAYVPVLNLPRLGLPARDRRHGLAQLTGVLSPGAGAPRVVTQYYSYRSLLTFRLLAESPLPFREGIEFMRLLVPSLAILGVNHADAPSPARTLRLRRGPDADGSGDVLVVEHATTPAEEARMRRAERDVIACFRRLGCWPLGTVRPGPGSSIHYAGTFPMSASGGDLASGVDGLLAGTRAVHLADGSAFPTLPAKGLTFTIMANADRVATILARRLA